MNDKPFAVTLDVGSSLANKTGSWRTERPVYVERTAPCGLSCPAGEDVRGWLYDAESGEPGYERAWRRIMEANPFPAIMGRVCYHPCQTACNRTQVDEAVGINAVERFLGDLAIERGWTVPPSVRPTGHRVLVVGAGPAGLAAAYGLARLGHAVTVRDAEPEPGGMMRYGIPAYRLPRPVIDAEVARIVGLGVQLELGRPVVDLLAEKSDGNFDAVFLAVGAHLARRAYVPAGEAARIVDAVSVLHAVAEGERPQLGRRVVVYGGGNTALDAARTARRLGASDAVVVYRRTRDRMPAADVEVEEATAEGVRMRWLSVIAGVEAGRVRVERVQLDENGFPQPTGEYEELDADSVVLALGQEADLRLLDGVSDVTVEDGVVRVGPDLRTGHPGIFAGGDMVPADRTVTTGVGHGMRAAQAIDGWLQGRPAVPAPRAAAVAETATFDLLNPWYFSDAPHAVRDRLETARRASTFDEVVTGLDAGTALYEARRCMSCGSCFECDNCFGVCPDNAVIKLGPGERYEIDEDYCKGCGICAQECPCGAIRMEPEDT